MAIKYKFEPTTRNLYIDLFDDIYMREVVDHFKEVLNNESITNINSEVLNLNEIKDFALAEDEALLIRTEFIKYKLNTNLKATIMVAGSLFHQGIAKMIKEILGNNMEIHIVKSESDAEALTKTL